VQEMACANKTERQKQMMDMHGTAGVCKESHLPSLVNGTVSLVSISVGHLISKGLFDDCKRKKTNLKGSKHLFAIKSFLRIPRIPKVCSESETDKNLHIGQRNLRKKDYIKVLILNGYDFKSTESKDAYIEINNSTDHDYQNYSSSYNNNN